MRLKAMYQKYTLNFKFEAGTSRGVLTQKETYFIKLWDTQNNQIYGLGECSVLKGLSIDDRDDYEAHLAEICAKLENIEILGDYSSTLGEIVGDMFPSILFGFEMAIRDLLNGGKRLIYHSPFTENMQAIPINGLVWMGEENFMLHQIDEKLKQGYTCLKLKIGAIDFNRECALLEYIRKNYSHEQITLRVDANGAFKPEEAINKLKILAQFGLHSIEQPIKQGQKALMKELCRKTPVPIALDEELIGIMPFADKVKLLEEVQPQYIILKPSLLGGFRHSLEWIDICKQMQIDWWITSALESNVGLNAISQFTATLDNPLPQGLGTGQLYTNNFDSPLEIKRGNLHYNLQKDWKTNQLFS